MQFESLNRVEIKGRINDVRITEFSETSMARLSVGTDYAYKDITGNPVIESTWHSIVVWEGKAASKETIKSLAKGDAVHVIGRIRMQRYTAVDGSERSQPEILAHSLKKLSAD